MKKIILSVLSVLCLVTIVSFVVYETQTKVIADERYNTILENIEAFTSDESVNVGCYQQCFPSNDYNCIITVYVGPDELFSIKCDFFRKGL